MQTATICKTMIKFWYKFHIQIHWYGFTRDNSFLQTPTSLYQENRKTHPPIVPKHNNSFGVYFSLDSEL